MYCVLQEETSLDVSDLVGIDPEIYNTVSHLQVSLLPISYSWSVDTGNQLPVYCHLVYP